MLSDWVIEMLEQKAIRACDRAGKEDVEPIIKVNARDLLHLLRMLSDLRKAAK